jgi:protoporphyrinogen oxidase
MSDVTAEYGVLGGGIAGLTIAREIARAGRSVVVLEQDAAVGGLARTIRWDGYAFDLGGHRFHSNNPDVVGWLQALMGNDLLSVQRRSRIHVNGRFVDYPIRLRQATVAFGPLKAGAIACSYAASLVAHRDSHDHSFEQWVIRRYGRVLYDIYFRPYTEKVWGIPCTDLSADWAAQRISLPSLPKALYHAIVPSKNPPPTIVQHFYYPRNGYGTIGDRLADEIIGLGGQIACGTSVTRIDVAHETTTISVRREGTVGRVVQCGHVISTIPVGTLLATLAHDADVARVATDTPLPYRGVMLVLLQLNRTSISADSWTYFPSPSMLLGRTHEPKNWSPAMVPDPDVTSLAVEIFSSPGDGVWETPDPRLVARTVEDLAGVGWIRPSDVRASRVVRAPYAYPVYTLDYRERVARVRAVLARWPSLSLLGRTGAFSYRNVDGVVEDSFFLAGQLGLTAGAPVERLAADRGRWI